MNKQAALRVLTTTAKSIHNSTMNKKALDLSVIKQHMSEHPEAYITAGTSIAGGVLGGILDRKRRLRGTLLGMLSGGVLGNLGYRGYNLYNDKKEQARKAKYQDAQKAMHSLGMPTVEEKYFGSQLTIPSVRELEKIRDANNRANLIAMDNAARTRKQQLQLLNEMEAKLKGQGQPDPSVGKLFNEELTNRATGEIQS